MKLNPTLNRKAFVLILVPLLCELVFVAVLAWTIGQAEAEARREENIQHAIATGSRLILIPPELQTCLASFVTTGDKSLLQRYATLTVEMDKDLARLKALVHDNESQAQALWQVENSLKKLTAVYDQFLADSATNTNADNLWIFRSIQYEFTPAVAAISSDIRRFLDAEHKIEESSPNAGQRLRQQVGVLVWAGVLGNILVAVALAVYFNRSTASRLSVLMDNIKKLAAGSSLNPMLEGQDELAALDKVFHEMAAALNEALRKERAVIENAVDVICSLTKDGRFTRVNPASKTVWGYLPEDLIDRDVVEFLAPEDVRPTIDAQLGIIDGRTSAPYENRFKCKDGSQLTMLWTTHWSELDDSLFCVAHDITERKLAEEALKASEANIRFVMANMPVGLIVLSLDGTIEMVNSSMEEMFHTGEGALLNKRLPQLLSDGEQGGEDSWTSLRDRAVGHIHQTFAKREDGSTFPAHISLRSFDSANRNRLLGIVLDVTERHEVERFKQEFIGVVSHELRTPLTSIRGSFEMLLSGVFGEMGEEAKQVLSIAERSSTRLIKLVTDLLDVEKLESGKLDMYMEPTEIAAVVEMSIESVKQFAIDHGIELDASHYECSVFADGERLVQVLVNLLSNAIKYSPRGSTVKIDYKLHEDELELQVIDCGRGIPETHIGKIFDRYQQVEKADATKKQGTGLGLAICKAIIEQHGGTIGVASETGKGSTFWFKVPLQSTKGVRAPYVMSKADAAGSAEQEA